MAGPLLGVAPCPTTIFTIGLLMLVQGRKMLALAIIPSLWSMVGFAAAIELGIWEDLGLPIAALVLMGILAMTAAPNRRQPQS
jgi:hypothetical protein